MSLTRKPTRKFDNLIVSIIVVLKWHYDENLIFPIQAILKHKQEVCMRGHTRRLQAVTKVKDTVIRISSLLMTVR